MAAIARIATAAGAALLCGAWLLATAASATTLQLAAGSRLMIAARVNGHAVTALLDSAAESTILDQDFARRLGLASGAAVSGQGSGQASFEASLVKGVTLEALGLSLPGQTVAVADLGDVGRRLLKQRLDVILGREIFDAARIAIDIEARTIEVVPRTAAPRGARLELVTEHGVETLPVRLGGASLRATFDLGNGSHVLVSESCARRLHLLDAAGPVRTEKGGGLGGEADRRLVTLPPFELAGRRFAGLEAAVDSQASASDLNVGVEVLRHFLITVDYAQHAAWLLPRD